MLNYYYGENGRDLNIKLLRSEQQLDSKMLFRDLFWCFRAHFLFFACRLPRYYSFRFLFEIFTVTLSFVSIELNIIKFTCEFGSELVLVFLFLN